MMSTVKHHMNTMALVSLYHLHIINERHHLNMLTGSVMNMQVEEMS